MEGKDSKIAESIQHIITCIHGPDLKEVGYNMHSFARKVLNSGSGKNNPQSMQDLRQKIMSKVTSNFDQHSAMQCQEAIQRFMKQESICQKQEVLRMLYKLSELNMEIQGDLTNIFKPPPIRRGLNTIIETYASDQIEQSYNQPLNFPLQAEQQLFVVRNRGSLQQGITESDLVKQLSFVFTNTNTSQIIEVNDGYQLRPSLNISDPARRIINDIADLGWLHKRISGFSQRPGSVRKALREAINEELKQFYIWNSTMEELVKLKKLSLRKLYTLSFYPEQILRWLAIILQAAQPFDGCHIISIVNSYRPNGLASVDSLINRLLSFVIRPLLNYIKHWIYKGELLDSRSEYFISENAKVSQGEEWMKRFRIIPQNIPSILDEQAAEKIFDAGKTIYFLIQKFKIYYEIKVPFIQTEKIDSIQLQGGNSLVSSTFMGWLNQVHKEVNQVLVQTLINKFYLKHHLQSIKSFFLCGKGDFIQQLYDSLHEILSQRHSNVSEHTLNGYISDAISKCFQDFKLPHSNNYFKQAIVDRLISKKIEFSSNIDGWDRFNFQYMLNDIEPLRTIFSSQVMVNYQKVFDFLWKLKKMKELLKHLWTSLSRFQSEKVRKLKSRKLTMVFHFFYLVRNKMFHFIASLHSYLMVAIQESWNKFWQQIDSSKSFDDILKKHIQFQRQILQIVFCTPNFKSMKENIYNIFKVIFDFKIFHQKLQQNFDAYYERVRYHQDSLAQIKQGIMINQAQKPPLFPIQQSQKDAKKIKGLFDMAFKDLYMQLTKESESKVSNLQVLATRLDFSEYYQTVTWSNDDVF